MRKSLTILILAAALPAGAAWADDDCYVPMADWQPRAAVAQLAEANGWTISRIKIDDGCYKVIGTDPDGRPFKAKIQPATLEIIRLQYEDDEGGFWHHRDKEEHHD